MFSQANPRWNSLPRTGYRRASYLTTHRQVRYFHITVPHHLQSLLGKKEIRRSLDGLDSRMARSKAMRLSVIAQTFFAFLDDVQGLTRPCGKICLRLLWYCACPPF